jgi:ribosomal protein S18 acetylase RimI-like enzyme
MITYKTSKKLSPERLYKLYEVVGWTNSVQNKKKHGELIAAVYANSSGVVSAWEGEKMIGVIRFVTDKTAHGILFGLVVDPKHQGKGIATTLIQKCMDKYPVIEWSVEAENAEVVTLFKKLGYKKAKYTYMNTANCPV